MEAKDRIKQAYEYLQGVGLARTQIDVADKMNVRKESVNQAFSGSKSYLTKSFILKFNNAFGNIFNSEWLMDGKGEMLNHNYQSVGDINNSSVHGVNVNGKEIHFECPFDKKGFDLLINTIEQNQRNIETFQQQINRLITLLEKKYEQ